VIGAVVEVPARTAALTAASRAPLPRAAGLGA
jgi:hypothetical protein